MIISILLVMVAVTANAAISLGDQVGAKEEYSDRVNIGSHDVALDQIYEAIEDQAAYEADMIEGAQE